jgi:hypothetical protein
MFRMFDWIHEIFAPKEEYIGKEPLHERSTNDRQMNISKLLVQWFDYLDLYHEAYPKVRGMSKQIHPNMSFKWGSFHFNGGAYYSGNGISIKATKERSAFSSYEGEIAVKAGYETIVVWQNGSWRHEIPPAMKDHIYKHLAYIQQFNDDCKKVDFTTLIREEKDERERKKQEEEARTLKAEQERLLRYYGDQKKEMKA